MIEFHFETPFTLEHEERIASWLRKVITSNQKAVGPIAYIFCDDAYLLQINQTYLNHDDFTDIISFDYSDAGTISGDIFISVERVRENANTFDVPFENELLRVMVHGILHYLGHKDKSKREKELMRAKEEEMLTLFHVEP